MRISQMTDAFKRGWGKSGLGMKVTIDEDTTILTYYGKKMAEITNRTKGGYRLTIFPESGSHTIGYRNRVTEVLRQPSSYRYSCYGRYGTSKLYDAKLHLEVSMYGVMEFDVVDGKPRLDYELFEQTQLTPDEPVAELTVTSSESTLTINQLMAVVANI